LVRFLPPQDAVSHGREGRLINAATPVRFRPQRPAACPARGGGWSGSVCVSGCSSAWPERVPRAHETAGSNPATQTGFGSWLRHATGPGPISRRVRGEVDGCSRGGPWRACRSAERGVCHLVMAAVPQTVRGGFDPLTPYCLPWAPGRAIIAVRLRRGARRMVLR
jgi:hypothetical protein